MLKKRIATTQRHRRKLFISLPSNDNRRRVGLPPSKKAPNPKKTTKKNTNAQNYYERSSPSEETKKLLIDIKTHFARSPEKVAICQPSAINVLKKLYPKGQFHNLPPFQSVKNFGTWLSNYIKAYRVKHKDELPPNTVFVIKDISINGKTVPLDSIVLIGLKHIALNYAHELAVGGQNATPNNLQSLLNQLETAKLEAALADDKVDEKLASMKTKTVKLDEKLDVMKTQIATLDAERAAAKINNPKLDARLENMKTETAKLDAECADIKTKIAELDKKLAAIRQSTSTNPDAEDFTNHLDEVDAPDKEAPIYHRLAYYMLSTFLPRVPIQLKQQYLACVDDLTAQNLKDQHRGIGDFFDLCLSLCDHTQERPDIQSVLSKTLPYPPTLTHLTTYGMTFIVNSILAAKEAAIAEKQDAEAPLTATHVTPGYFETSSAIDLLKQRQVITLHETQEPTFKTDGDEVLFMEIHPNNASSKYPIQRHNIEECLKQVASYPSGKLRLLVIDSTLSTLNSDEIQDLLKKVQPLIDAGKLGVVIGQSLVKYTPCGIDVATAGLVTAFLPDTNLYKHYAKYLTTYCEDSSASSRNKLFFSKLLTQEAIALQQDYLKTIQDNTQYLSKKVHNVYESAGLSTKETREVDLHLNDDRGTTYLSFHFPDMIKRLKNAHPSESEQKIDTIIKDRMALIESIWLQVFDDMGVTVTNRMSFGFPFCNLSECGGSFRFTLGIEDPDELDKIANAIGVFTILMQHSLDPTNALNTEDTCNERLARLKETARQFLKDGFTKEVTLSVETIVGSDPDGYPIEAWETEKGTSVIKWDPENGLTLTEKNGIITDINACDMGCNTYNAHHPFQQIKLLLAIDENNSIGIQSNTDFIIHQPKGRSLQDSSHFLPENDTHITIIDGNYRYSDVPTEGKVMCKTNSRTTKQSVSVDNKGIEINGILYPNPLLRVMTTTYPHSCDVLYREMSAEQQIKFHHDLFSGCYRCKIETGRHGSVIQLTQRNKKHTYTIEGKTVTLRIKNGDWTLTRGKKTYNKTHVLNHDKELTDDSVWDIIETLKNATHSQSARATHNNQNYLRLNPETPQVCIAA